ncbi:MAG: AzlD domain-containing protein [Candidatus Binatia bacterium]
MGLVTYLVRVIPQLLLVGRSFPEVFDRYLRYLAYAFITSIVSNSLFLSAQRFDTGAAPYRGIALVGAMLIALWSRSIVTGMLFGTLLVVGLTWLR